MRIPSVMLVVVGAVVLVSCLLTIFFFPPDSALLWGKVFVGTLMIAVALVLDWKAITRAAANRATAFVGTSVVLSLALAVALGAVYVLAREHRVEVDLTRERIYTLSDQTLKLLSQLDRDVTVRAFYARSAPQSEMLRHMARRYRMHSDRLELELIDPDRRPDLVETYGIQEDSPRVVVSAGEREARFREISEEALTNALLQVTQQAARRIYFLIGHGEAGIDDADEAGYQATAADLRAEGYEVMSLNLVEIGKVPDDSSLLVLPGPRQPLLAPELEQLNGYLDRGGKLLVLLEPGSDPGLREFLRRYKLGYRDDTVLDASPYGQLFGVGPDAAVVVSYEDHPAVRDLAGSMSIFSGARSLQSIDEGEGVDPAVTAMPLFASNPRTWGETALAAGDWQWDEGEARGPVILAAVATKNTSTAERKLADEARLILMGDSSFGDNRFRTLQVNRDLLLNTVAWLAELEDRVAIRPRQRGASRIVLSSRQEALIAFFALDGLPVALLAFGLGIWLVRRRR